MFFVKKYHTQTLYNTSDKSLNVILCKWIASEGNINKLKRGKCLAWKWNKNMPGICILKW